jgi:S-DNA-T family DNA segregation ATPase FtsK/SpoIIIE
VRAFAWLALALLVAAALGSHSLSDPAFTTTGAGGEVGNLAGNLGAMLADVLLTLFGHAAWWWVLLLLGLAWRSFRSLDAQPLTHPRQVWFSGGGFLLVLAGFAGIEALRLGYLASGLPGGPGGVMGQGMGGMFESILGFTGGTLVLLLVWAAGLSLFTGLSWLRIAEQTGALLENAALGTLAWLQRKRDERIGAQATVVRAAKVEKEKRRQIESEPLRIEPVVQDIEPSKKAVAERQAPLFEDLPGTPTPPLSLLDAAVEAAEPVSAEILEFTSRQIELKLQEFGVEVKVVSASPGPVITRYEIEPATGVKGNQIVNLARDLARVLSVVSIRVVEAIPGRHTMGMEIPNTRRQMVRLSEILSSSIYHDTASPLTVALGKDISGKPVVADLARMPHLLVAGTTGSGKSVGINAMILSLLYKADAQAVRLILIDPKMLELSVYEGIPHLLAPVVTDMRQAASALNWCVVEMDRRYKLMSALGVRNLSGYNHKVREAIKAGTPLTHPFSLTPDAPEPLDTLPLIVVVIDELADLMMVVGKKVEELIARLAQKARASGIHLVLATQRPSVDVITGLIKANIPSRIAFQVSSKIDSRTILDQMGAEALLGQGDMLYLASGNGLPARVHGAFVADDEVHRVVAYLKLQGEADYIEGILDSPDEADAETGEAGGNDAETDPLYDEAVALVLKTRRASVSAVQRHLRIGYNRAARLVDAMERAGLVSAMQSNGNRDILSPQRD